MEHMPEHDREPIDPHASGDDALAGDDRAGVTDPALDAPDADDRAFDDELRELEAQQASEAPREVPARMVRQARMGRFLGLGAIVGLLLAVVLTMLWPDDPNFVPDNPTLTFSDVQVFGFLAVYLVPLCLGIAGLVGYLLGKSAERRTARDVTLERDER